MTTLDDDYPCVGVCMVDAETGYCLECGRPPSTEPMRPAQENAGVLADAAQVTASDSQKSVG